MPVDYSFRQRNPAGNLHNVGHITNVQTGDPNAPPLFPLDSVPIQQGWSGLQVFQGEHLRNPPAMGYRNGTYSPGFIAGIPFPTHNVTPGNRDINVEQQGRIPFSSPAAPAPPPSQAPIQPFNGVTPIAPGMFPGSGGGIGGKAFRRHGGPVEPMAGGGLPGGMFQSNFTTGDLSRMFGGKQIIDGSLNPTPGTGVNGDNSNFGNPNFGGILRTVDLGDGRKVQVLDLNPGGGGLGEGANFDQQPPNSTPGPQQPTTPAPQGQLPPHMAGPFSMEQPWFPRQGIGFGGFSNPNQGTPWESEFVSRFGRPDTHQTGMPMRYGGQLAMGHAKGTRRGLPNVNTMLNKMRSGTATRMAGLPRRLNRLGSI